MEELVRLALLPYTRLLPYSTLAVWRWIGFRLTPEHRYELLGDFRFFAVENTGGTEAYRGAGDEIAEFYDQQHASFAAHKAAFRQTGQICRVNSRRDPTPVAALSRLGGVAPRDSGADDILLYYDPVGRIVLPSFVFT